ncbi:hypothetical protein [Legionella quateirensis]|uniref:Transmembrane protein n=1 Tax=Legionella quateirensis TaxID=45072 RepID=A0A378KU72_9GAMM|nr:hypothetical protein [Legionella quateirensis]KTD50868.1 hypothetical protein Lqua_1095 [Legionella quateirensis]STY17886.1 Uncharacterised protein [Legionella quateirensis]
MADIKVHVLNFHSIWTHIEIVLENTSTEPHTYYGVNRWESPTKNWSVAGPKAYIAQADSSYTFYIKANPDEITKRWRTYWAETWNEAGILSNNCAVAAQWFLTEFAGIPKPSLSNLSLNLLAFGIMWPSFIPCPVTLSGRVMSNVKFHVEARTNPEISAQYSYLFLYTSIVLATLVFAASVFALALAASILSGGIAVAVIAGCGIAGAASSYGFFKAYNLLSAKNSAEEFYNTQKQSVVEDELLASDVEHSY